MAKSKPTKKAAKPVKKAAKPKPKAKPKAVKKAVKAHKKAVKAHKKAVKKAVKKATEPEPSESPIRPLVYSPGAGPLVGADGSDVRQFHAVARECQGLARALGDRQNSDSKLSARQCEAVVTCLLNAGNLMEEAAKRTEAGAPPESVYYAPEVANPEPVPEPTPIDHTVTA